MSNERTAPNQNQPAEIINPSSQGAVNAMISAAVSEAVKSVFASLQPHLSAMALSPEKLAIAIKEANRPVITPEAMALKLREERESLKSREDEQEVRKQTAARQASCSHQDRAQHEAISLIHNWPDHMPRGICPLCHILIEPACWKIGTAITHPERKDHAYIQPESPLYFRVRNLESMS
jgi:hypothetical protein